MKVEGATPIMSLIKPKVMAAMKTTRGYTAGRFILVLSSEASCDLGQCTLLYPMRHSVTERCVYLSVTCVYIVR